MPTNTKEAGDQNLHVSFPVLCTDLKMLIQISVLLEDGLKRAAGGGGQQN